MKLTCMFLSMEKPNLGLFRCWRIKSDSAHVFSIIWTTTSKLESQSSWNLVHNLLLSSITTSCALRHRSLDRIAFIVSRFKACGHLQHGDLKNVVDQTLGDDFNIESMWKAAEIAMTSVEPKSVHWPRMSVVCQELRDADEMENLSSPSTNSYLSHPFSSLSFEKTPHDVAKSYGYSSVLSPH